MFSVNVIYSALASSGGRAAGHVGGLLRESQGPPIEQEPPTPTRETTIVNTNVYKYSYYTYI